MPLLSPAALRRLIDSMAIVLSQGYPRDLRVMRRRKYLAEKPMSALATTF